MSRNYQANKPNAFVWCSLTEPSSLQEGDLWYDETLSKLKVKNDAGWVEVGTHAKLDDLSTPDDNTDLDAWLDTKSEGDLTTLGYTPGEVAQLKSAFADADELATIFEGIANLSVAKDFRAFLKLVWGFGGIEVEP